MKCDFEVIAIDDGGSDYPVHEGGWRRSETPVTEEGCEVAYLAAHVRLLGRVEA